MEISDTNQKSIVSAIHSQLVRETSNTDDIAVKNEGEKSMELTNDVLIKLEPFDQNSEDICHNVYDSVFEVVNNDLCHNSPRKNRTDASLRTKQDSSPAAESLARGKLDTLLVNVHKKIASLMKDNHFHAAKQQPLNKAEETDKCVRSRSMAPRATHKKNLIRQCTHCHYTTTHMSNLVIHMRTHTGEKPYSCPHCGYKCSGASSLKAHIRTHTGEKPHSCNQCDYKCAEAKNLKAHMRTHTGEKRFICKVCNHKTAEKNKLVLHMRTHSGEKPYSCNYCNYKCAQAGNLRVHMKIHTGEKRFTCSICNYKFKAKQSLFKHMMKH